ncbi:hypothetical protein M758_2G022100 [Ceratodon purpureus]|nr:hypothetical protein M758_2G022100 [Ceratodon purpureus]
MTRVSRRDQTSLAYASQLGALEARGDGSEIHLPRGLNVRAPMYKANDSSDLHLIELISPSNELQRKLAEGRRSSMTQQQQSKMYLLSTSKSLDNTPRTPANVHFTRYNKQGASNNTQLPPSRPAFTTRPFFPSNDAPARPRTAATTKRPVVDQRRGGLKKPTKKGQIPMFADQVPQSSDYMPFTDRMHHHPESFEDVRIYNSELSRGCREKENPSGFLTERSNAPKSVQLKLPANEDQKASDLRLISKLWHQECKCSVTIQQRLAYLLDSKYKEAFEDGRMYTVENCKHNDFKAEVARILKKLERAGAPQLPTLNVKYELAVACVDEVFGKGMGEEYMKLETYFMQPTASGNMMSARDANQVKEIAERVQQEYKDVHNITGFMLDQLSLFE